MPVPVDTGKERTTAIQERVPGLSGCAQHSNCLAACTYTYLLGSAGKCDVSTMGAYCARLQGKKKLRDSSERQTLDAYNGKKIT